MALIKKDDPQKIAEELFEREEYVEAFFVIDEAFKKYKGKKLNELKGDDQKDLIHLIQLEARVYERMGQSDKARQRLQSIKDQSFGMVEGEKDDPKKIAEELIKREEYVEAFVALNKAFKKYKDKKLNELKGDDQKDLIHLIQLEASAFERIGQRDKARQKLQSIKDQSFDMDESEKDDPKKIAEELIKREEYAQALSVLLKAKRKYKGKKLKELSGNKCNDLVRLIQLEASAYSRMGQLEKAQKLLQELRDQGFDDAETLGLYARTCKDLYFRTGDLADLKACRNTYARAFSPENQLVADAGYVGINAAAMSVLLRESKKALNFTQKVKQVIGKPNPKNYWDVATLAEAELIEALFTKDKIERAKIFERAGKIYAMAVDESPLIRGSHGSTWLQARRLMRAMKVSAEESALIGHAFRRLTDDGKRQFNPTCGSSWDDLISAGSIY